MIYLKQSTAKTFRIGPFVDQSDGYTPEVLLTLTQADYRLSKAGGAFAQKNDATAGAHDENGWYTCILNATDTNTLGSLIIAVNESGALPVWVQCTVLPANVFDSLISGSDSLEVDAVAISGDSTAADNLETAADGGSYNLGGGGIVAASVTGAVASVTGAVGSVSGNVGGNVVGSVGSVAAGGITAASIASGAVDADALAADAVAEIADGVWDEARAGHVGAGSFGEGVASVQGNVTGSVASVTGAVGSVTGNVGGNVVGTIGDLAAAAKASVNTEVDDVISVDTETEPAAGTPTATPTLIEMLKYLYFELIKNKSDCDATTLTVYKNDGVTARYTRAISDVAGTATRGAAS